MRLLRLFAFWACLVWTAAAAGLEIVGPSGTVRPSQPVWLEIAGAPEGAAASFFPSDVLTTGPPHVMPRHALFHADAAGAYQVNAFVTVVDWQARTITTTPLLLQDRRRRAPASSASPGKGNHRRRDLRTGRSEPTEARVRPDHVRALDPETTRGPLALR